MEADIRSYILIGAGGFGREVMPLVLAQLRSQIDHAQARVYFAVEGMTDEREVNGVPLISLDHARCLPGDIHFNIAIADSRARERIALACIASGMTPFPIAAASALDLVGNRIGAGAIFCPFSIVMANVRAGRFFHLNAHSYVGHDCEIGDFVTFAPGVRCNGNIRIEDHAYVGAGAMIMPGSNGAPLTIGRGAIIGIGAVVLSPVPEGATMIGNPARRLPSC